MSGDVLASIKAIKKLGVKVYVKNNICKIHGVGINGYKYKKNIVLNAGNSGTLARLIMGLLVHSKNKIFSRSLAIPPPRESRPESLDDEVISSPFPPRERFTSGGLSR